MPFSFDALRRWPDLEAPGLLAADAADRLIVDESAEARAGLDDGQLVVIGDAYGALTLAAAEAGARGIRVHQDELTGEQALAANADTTGLTGTFSSLGRDAALLSGARVVLLRLPRSLRELHDLAGLIARHAHPDVVVFAGGRLKHMTPTMNEVLRARFDRVDVSHARQKSRVLTARGPHDGAEPDPERTRVDDLEIRAFGGAFAGASLDIGTRLLLAHLPEPADGDAIDLACGTGIVAATLAMRHPSLRVLACDQSAIAVDSARATAEANGLDDRITVVRDDMMRSRADDSAAFIALNPPFHSGAAVTEGIAPRMFAEAARVLRPGGELWTVWNSALQYRPALERLVGPTRQIARDRKFTVTVSTKR
ncbi:MAG: methyltransferase [Microbacterium enclense]